MNENRNKGRIPVRPLPYSERDIAMTREIIIDYDKGNIYITDKDDASVLIDITELIANSYLSNINGDNTNVTINGEVYNLAELLAELKRNKVEIRHSGDAVSVPADVKYDSVSVTILDGFITLHGFTRAANESRPVKRNGELVWETPEDAGDPSEPSPGASDNRIHIFPTHEHIILYAKPWQYTCITQSLFPEYTVVLPFSQPRCSNFKWKLDINTELKLILPKNIMWLNPEVSEYHQYESYVFSFETWDYGYTWIASYTKETLTAINPIVNDFYDNLDHIRSVDPVVFGADYIYNALELDRYKCITDKSISGIATYSLVDTPIIFRYKKLCSIVIKDVLYNGSTLKETRIRKTDNLEEGDHYSYGPISIPRYVASSNTPISGTVSGDIEISFKYELVSGVVTTKLTIHMKAGYSNAELLLENMKNMISYNTSVNGPTSHGTFTKDGKKWFRLGLQTAPNTDWYIYVSIIAFSKLSYYKDSSIISITSTEEVPIYVL